MKLLLRYLLFVPLFIASCKKSKEKQVDNPPIKIGVNIVSDRMPGASIFDFYWWHSFIVSGRPLPARTIVTVQWDVNNVGAFVETKVYKDTLSAGFIGAIGICTGILQDQPYYEAANKKILNVQCDDPDAVFIY